jgi:hypothetical protein
VGRHVRRWGWVYVLTLVWLGTWAGQAWAMADLPAREFVAATLENWQSEFLQLAVQTGVVVGAAEVAFRRSTEDQRRIEAKIDRALAELGVKPDDVA